MKPRHSRTFLSAVFWNAILVAVSFPLGVLISVVIGRWLGPEGKGDYTLATLIGGLFLTALNLGLPASISYFLGGDRVAQSSLVKTVIVMAGLLSAAGIAVAWLLDRSGWCVWLFGLPRLSQAAWIVLIGLPFALAGTFLQFVVLAQGREVMFAVLPALAQLSVAAVAAGFIVAGKLTPAAAAMAVVTSQVLTASVLLGYEQQRVRWLAAPLLPAGPLRELTGYSLLTHLGNSLQFLVQRLDVFMLSVMAGVRDVGLYSVAYATAELLLLLPQRLGCLYLPRAAAPQRQEQKTEEIQRLSSLLFLATPVAAVVLGMAGTFLIPWLYGPAFAPSVPPLLLLLPGVAAMGTASVQAAYLAGAGRVRTNTMIAAIALLGNVLLNLVLIPRFGASGAALASSLTYCGESVALARAAAHQAGVPPLTMITSTSLDVVGVLLRGLWRRRPATLASPDLD